MIDETERARETLAGIPGFAAVASSARISRLAGLTNLVFRVETPSARYLLRLPGKGTEVYIDRRVEAVNARAAAAAGVAPEVLYFGNDGLMVARGAAFAAPVRAVFDRDDGHRGGTRSRRRTATASRR